MPLWKRRIYFYTMVVVFLVIVPIIAFYAAGYRFDSGFEVVSTGGMYVYAPLSGATITIDEEKEKETGTFQKSWFVQNLTPGDYSVRVTKEGYHPWSKGVEVKQHQVAEAIAFFVPKHPSLNEIPRTILVPPDQPQEATTTTPNPQFQNLQLAFAQASREITTSPETRPTATSTPQDPEDIYAQVSPRSRVALWEEHNQLFATWLKDRSSLPQHFCRADTCEKTVVVHFSFAPIKYFDFFPGREDVVIVAAQHSVFAIDIDTRGNQNIMPLYKGTDPTFINNNGTIYIRDNGRIFALSLLLT